MIQVPMTPAEFDAKAGQLKAKGVTLAGTSGVIEKNGARIAWRYDGAELTATVEKHPFFASNGFVEGELATWLKTPSPGDAPTGAQEAGVVG